MMQDTLTLLTVVAAVLYLLKVFVLPSIKPSRAPDVPLKNLTRKIRRRPGSGASNCH